MVRGYDGAQGPRTLCVLDRGSKLAGSRGALGLVRRGPALGTALCEPGEVGPRAGAGGSRRWVPLPSFHLVATLPSPSSPGVPGRELAASYWKCPEAALLLALITLPCWCGHSKGTFLRISTEKCTGPASSWGTWKGGGRSRKG